MKPLLCSVVFWLFVSNIYSQQLPLFGQYRENHALINPASIGTQYWTQSEQFRSAAGITARRQWTRFEDGPLTVIARFENIVPKYSMVYGINIFSDKTGPTKQTGGQLRYAYMLMDDDNGRWLSIGLSGGLYQWTYNADEAVLRDAGDLVGRTNVSNSTADLNAGVYYASYINDNTKLFYTGFSMLQAVSVRFSEDIIKKTPHFYGNIGCFLKNQTNNGDEYFVEPSAWILYVPNTPILTDLTCRFYTPANFWIGMGQSISISAEGEGKSIKGNNLFFEIGFSTDESWDGKSLNIGLGYHRSFTRFGEALGNSIELNITTSWK
jgi:type IX secretion system PorP/SprF family membrane protein